MMAQRPASTRALTEGYVLEVDIHPVNYPKEPIRRLLKAFTTSNDGLIAYTT